jgi:Adenylosuccinate lyase
MIDRYITKAMRPIWSDENKYQAWLEVEIAAVEAWSKLGEIPAEDAKKVAENAKFNVDEIKEIEKVTKHDVVAFTRDVSRSLGDEKKWVHFGLTSTDVVDTAYGYLMKQANDIIKKTYKTF